MAPGQQKRARAHTGNDATVLEVETATSSLRQDARKRRRISADDESSSGTSPSPTPPPPARGKEYELYDFEERRDRQFEDLEFEEQDDQRASRILQARLQQHTEQMPAENAIIEEIRCENFMCHSKLTVKLGPFINFIIGHNGSGKSAVLTALALCLGGKATSTNRGQNLKAFIKEGQETAMLSVRIKNQGSSAYMHDLYGDSIIVERHFSKSSTSGFKIKNVHGKVITTKKSDLEDITDAFALQIDNPMNVLTQDMARQFLNSSTQSDKYKFFIKGTQLEQLSHDYRMLEESFEQAEIQSEKAEQNLKIHERNLAEAQKKLAASHEQENLRRKVVTCQNQYAWSQVIEQEQFRDVLLDQVQQATGKIAEKEAQYQTASEQFATVEGNLEAAQQHTTDITTKRGPFDEQYQAKAKEIEEADNKGRQIMEEQRAIKGEITAKQAEIQNYQQQREEQIQRQADADGGGLTRMHEAIEEANQDWEAAKQDFKTHQDALPDLLRERENAAKGIPDLEKQSALAKQELEQSKTLLKEHTGKEGNWTRAYHHTVQNVQRMIGSEKRWRQEPVGPFGKYIQLSEPKWSSVLESTFAGFLNAFGVTNKDDQVLLSNIMRRANYNGSVYIIDDAPITDTQEPDSQLLTFLRVLKFDHERVRNACITVNAIDQIVLIENREEANDFIDTRPAFVKACLCMHDGRVGEGHRLTLTGSGTKSIAPIRKFTRHPRMRTNAEAQLNIYRNNVTRNQQEYDVAERRVREIKSRITQLERTLQNHKKRYRDLQIASQRAEDRVAQLKEELEAVTPQAASTLAALEHQINNSEEELQMNQDSYRNARDERNVNNQLRATLRADLEELQKEIDEIEVVITEAGKAVKEFEKQRQRTLFEKNQAFAKIDDAKMEKQAIERRLQEAEATVEEYVSNASEVCPRCEVPASDTPAILERRYDRLSKEADAAHAALGASRQELAERSRVAKANLTQAQNGFDVIMAQCQALKVSMADRQARWKKFRRFISSRARITFSYLLSERDFRGKLSIDQKHKLLDINVEPDITKNSAKGRQTKTLSGGEKSFSTICLLLSLWDAMGSPIRCLDEFDVFMDNVNRDISMKMMIQAARRSVSRQFILITPQAMGNVAFGDDVKIIKMSDPERGQQTLPFNG